MAKTSKPAKPTAVPKPVVQVNKLPSPFGVTYAATGTLAVPAVSTSRPSTEPPLDSRALGDLELQRREDANLAEHLGEKPPAGETGRELSSTEAAAALAARKLTPKRLCPNCQGLGTIAQGQGKTRCPVCNGAGELART